MTQSVDPQMLFLVILRNRRNFCKNSNKNKCIFKIDDFDMIEKRLRFSELESEVMRRLTSPHFEQNFSRASVVC